VKMLILNLQNLSRSISAKEVSLPAIIVVSLDTLGHTVLRSDISSLGLGKPSLFSEVDTVWEVSAIRPNDTASLPDDLAIRPDDIQFFRYLQNLVCMRKGFIEDRPDARSSRSDANLIRIELRCF